MKFRLLLTAIFAALLCAGCSEEEKKNPEQPSLTIKQTEVQASAEGGEFTIGYTISNPVEDGTVKAECDAEWIAGLTVEDEGIIRFTVAENTLETPRSTGIEVSYTGLEPETIHVSQTQAEKEILDPGDLFEVEFTQITKTSFCTTMHPADKKMSYINFVNTSGYVSNYDDEALFEDDMRYIKGQADKWKLPFEEVLMEYVMEGDIIEQPMRGLQPDTEYTFYIYGFDLETQQRTTGILRKTVRTDAIQWTDAQFGIEVSVDGVIADVTITPQNDFDGYYFTNINYGLSEDTPKEDIDLSMTEYFKGLIGAWQSMGMTMDEIFMKMCHKGIHQQVYEVEPETVCFVSAFAVDEEGLICSDIAIQFFTSGSVDASKNSLSAEVTDIEARSAILHVTATNDDPYKYVILPTADLDGVSDSELISYLMMYYQNYDGIGTRDFELQALYPEKNYTVFVFGYDHSAVTTDPVRVDFQTPAAEYADFSVTMDYGKYYDSEDVAKLDSWYKEFAVDFIAFLPVHVSAQPEGCEIFWNVYDPAILEQPSISEESIIRALINGNGLAGEFEILQLPYGMHAMICAVAVDEEGNVSKLFKGQEVVIENDGVSNAQEFVDDYPGGSGNIHVQPYCIEK